MSLLRYDDFLTESKIEELLLESKVVFSKKFINMLFKMKGNKIADALLSLSYKDIPVVQNYIDVTDRKDFVSFTPDRKAQEMTKDSPQVWKVIESGRYLTNSHKNDKIFEALGYDKEKYGCWSPEVGTLGLRLRAAPNTTSATLAGEAMGTKLKVLEPASTAIPKIGVVGQWLNVTDPNNLVGYVAAWYVVKVTSSLPSSNSDSSVKTDSSEKTELTPGMIEQKYKVVASALWIRDKPDGNKIGYLWKDEIITVTEIADKWAYFEKGWVYMTYIVPV